MAKFMLGKYLLLISVSLISNLAIATTKSPVSPNGANVSKTNKSEDNGDILEGTSTINSTPKKKTKSSFSFNGNIELFTDDNVTKASASADALKDSGYILTGTANYVLGLNRLSAFFANANITSQEYSDFDGLSNTKISFTTSYIFQRRIAFAAPSYRIFLELNTLDSETDMRDRDGIIYGAELKKRLTDKLRMNAGFSFSTEKASGKVFDIDKTRLFTNFDLQYNSHFAFYTTLNYINGGIVSTAASNAATSLPFINNAAAIQFDEAFGGQDTGKAAYRLDDATTILISLGSNIAIDNKSSVDLSIDIINSSADGNITYDRQIARAVYLRRF